MQTLQNYTVKRNKLIFKIIKNMLPNNKHEMDHTNFIGNIVTASSI